MRNMSNTLRVTCPAYIGTSRNDTGLAIAATMNNDRTMWDCLTVEAIRKFMADLAQSLGTSVEACGLGVCGAPE